MVGPGEEIRLVADADGKGSRIWIDGHPRCYLAAELVEMVEEELAAVEAPLGDALLFGLAVGHLAARRGLLVDSAAVPPPAATPRGRVLRLVAGLDVDGAG